MDGYQDTHKGISAPEIYRALPYSRRHLFLRLMPYSWASPEEYVELQIQTYHALRPDQNHEGRAAAIMRIASFYDTEYGDMHERLEFLIEVANRALEREFSFDVVEWSVWAYLSSEGVIIDEYQATHEGAGVPVLQPSDPVKLRRALVAMQWAFEILERMAPDAQRDLPDSEARAAIRLLRLYSRYCEPIGGGSKLRARVDFFRQRAEPIWLRLSKFEYADRDAAIYGPEAVAALARLLDENCRAEIASAVQNPSRVLRPTPTPHRLMHTVVAGSFPPGKDDADKLMLKEFEVLRRPMPVAALPEVVDLELRRTQLLDEFLWGSNAINSVFDELVGRRQIGAVKLHFQHILLTGPAGSGKTHLARRLAEVLGLECYSASLAGASDAMSILGTARGWSTGQPSPLLRPLLKGNATVLVALDEVDKAADSVHGSPSVQNALLALLEPSESRHWRDVYLQAECDLSNFVFVLTCNSSVWLSQALRSRLREHEIRRPTRRELLHVAKFVVADIEREMDVPQGTFTGMPVEQLLPASISSLRALRRAVGAAMRHWMSLPGNAVRH
ncbi:hypothetical protein HNP55_001684 [Paucibacter oligotrophus]|uniref:AAA+ ATPase domain-containing protein n=1 Tax=Roseateles oligotrophus TaxID=1769250 RepID=A0A840L8U1_9BURK|nr:AAA family ATPase [Roseateles oligotrophus]MBB4843165.1 hypothetical protein [Roseateles oligotrophus]